MMSKNEFNHSVCEDRVVYFNLKSDTFMSKIIGVLLVIGSVIGTVACIAQHQFNPFTGVLLLLWLLFSDELDYLFID